MRLKALPGPTVKQTLRLSTLGAPPTQSRLSLVPPFTLTENREGRRPLLLPRLQGWVGDGSLPRQQLPCAGTSNKTSVNSLGREGLTPAGDQRVNHRMEQI